jgi:Domain of unknown function (DUF4375)
MRAAAAVWCTVLVLTGCGNGDTQPGEEDAGGTVPALTLSAEQDDLFARYDALVAGIDFDREEESVRELRPGDRALYVLWTVDGEINNGGFSQYLFNSTAGLHDEAVASAELIGARQTAAVLERLPGVLGLESLPEDRAERQRVLDGLSTAEEAALGRLDEEWFASISGEIEAKLLRHLRTHPEAFSPR